LNDGDVIIEQVSISLRRGIPKSKVDEARLIEDWGFEGDAHAGRGHRQVSLLAAEAVDEMIRRGAVVEAGSFAENLTVRGFDFAALSVGVRLRCGGDVVLEVTQIGKECHSRCAIFNAVGDCVMPREGIFARVVRGGIVRAGMIVAVVEEQSR